MKSFASRSDRASSPVWPSGIAFASKASPCPLVAPRKSIGFGKAKDLDPKLGSLRVCHGMWILAPRGWLFCHVLFLTGLALEAFHGFWAFRSRTNRQPSRFLGGVRRIAFMIFSGVSGMGSGIGYSTGRPRARPFLPPMALSPLWRQAEIGDHLWKGLAWTVVAERDDGHRAVAGPLLYISDGRPEIGRSIR